MVQIHEILLSVHNSGQCKHRAHQEEQRFKPQAERVRTALIETFCSLHPDPTVSVVQNRARVSSLHGRPNNLLVRQIETLLRVESIPATDNPWLDGR